ncbi:MAG: NAD(P)/FAD-dependent oxidoreductase [Calditrichaeota bacterium]|nr:NAD(P)/FAD-dependent oxidoreductase [Calditrichota bacterium]
MGTYDVVIIGAGVAGSVLARLLAKQGASVLLVEKDEYSGKTTACGGLLDKPYFDRYVDNPGVMEQHITRNVFRMPWGEVCFECDQVTVKRRVFDRHLAESAALEGARLVNFTRALGYRVKGSGQVEVELLDRASRERYRVQARIVAFADGPHTLGRHNPRFQHDHNRPFWAYAYAYEVEGVPFDPQEMRVYLDPRLAPWGYGWIFPNREDANIGVGTIQAEIDRGLKVKEKLFYFIEEYEQTASLLRDRKILDKKGGFIPMKLIRHFSDDSQVILGDAAGMVSPLFGAGIDYAIDAAEVCAPVLLESLARKDYSEQFLKRYDQALEERLLKDLRKQILISRIIIHSLKLGQSFPIKLLAVIAFGAKYNRWDKIKILTHPVLGEPHARRADNEVLLTHK